jgi:uncharacterized surface protein with fasciclin (FAS1) repeats
MKNRRLMLLAATGCVMLGLSAGAVMARGPSTEGETILDRLIRTDGSQALVAAVQAGEESGCLEGITDTLADPSAKVVLFAPSNRAFEEFLRLKNGRLDGLDIDAIASSLPDLLYGVELSTDDLCDLLLKHVAIDQGGPGNSSADDLLGRGQITVADGSVFPISVGSGDVAINYESEITQRDVFTVNGVIHFLDGVIVDVPPSGANTVTVFVTRGVFQGNLGGLTGDEVCSNAATAAGLSGTWTAWLSDETTDGRDRIPDGEYRLVDGTTIVAYDLADLTDGKLKAPIDQDENGNPWSQSVWTGTRPDGRLYTDAFGASETCNNWTDGTNDFDAVVGNSGAVDGNWTAFGNQAPLTPQLSPCSGFRSLYCFEVPE